jgi:hypothetical protein
MKKVLNLAAVLALGVLSSGVASAIYIPCGSNTIAYGTWSNWTAANSGSPTLVSGCTVGDKIFENFVPSTIPADTFVQFTPTLTGALINFINGGAGGSFTTDFTVGYTVTVNTALNPDGSNNTQNFAWRINKIAAGMQIVDSAVAVLTKSCTPACSPTPSATASGTTTTIVSGNVNNALSVQVTDSFDYTTGSVTNIGNQIFEVNTTVPEPSTFVLFGGALVGIGLLRRGRKSA